MEINKRNRHASMKNLPFAFPYLFHLINFQSIYKNYILEEYLSFAS